MNDLHFHDKFDSIVDKKPPTKHKWNRFRILRLKTEKQMHTKSEEYLNSSAHGMKWRDTQC